MTTKSAAPGGAKETTKTKKPARTKLAEVQSREDVERLSPAERSRLGAQTLPDGSHLDMGGVLREKPFPAADKVARAGI